MFAVDEILRSILAGFAITAVVVLLVGFWGYVGMALLRLVVA